MVSLHETVDTVKASVESADPALTREKFIALGIEEKAGANRKTLLKYLREAAKALPPIPGPNILPPDTTLVPSDGTDIPIDAPGEPPPDYVAPAGAISLDEAKEVAATLGVIKPLMQEIDPRPCDFPFRAMDINRYPVCVVHNSGLCLPCSHQEPPVMRCRVVCFAESDKHHNVKQPTVVMKDRVIENPATVEELSLSEFDG